MTSVTIFVSSLVVSKGEKRFAEMKMVVSFFESGDVAWPGDLKRLVETDVTVCQSSSLSEKSNGERSPV